MKSRTNIIFLIIIVCVVKVYPMVISRSFGVGGGDYVTKELRNTKFSRQSFNDVISGSGTVETTTGVKISTHQMEDREIAKRHTRTKRAATSHQIRLWDYGIIPYEIDVEYSSQYMGLFQKAMRHWENYTCIQFVKRNKTEHPDYIYFTQEPCGCCSYVGRRGNGSQGISIGKHCARFGNVVHELGHVVGFWHEHTRPDRDQHVQIMPENIMTGQEYNFNKLDTKEVNSLGVPYDFGSIMHYSKNTFAKWPYLETIHPLFNNNALELAMGQRFHLSNQDILQTNLLYRCPVCGQTLLGDFGTFSSPSSNTQIASLKERKCEWRIIATAGERIVLNITELDLQTSPGCQTDYIEVNDGYWVKSPLLGKFCGNTHVSPMTSSTNRLLVSYMARNPEGHRGFTAKYEVICGNELFLHSDNHLESPNYPDEYPPNKECVWKIKAPEKHQVVLNFISFDIEYHTACKFDYVEVRDGLSSDSDLLGIYCGYKLPRNIVSTSNYLFVKFVSDGTSQSYGFSAKVHKEYNECDRNDHGCAHECINILDGYQCRCRIGFELLPDGKNCEVSCGGVLNTTTGIVTSPSFPELYPPNKTCTWEIRAPPQFRIILNFTHFDIEGDNTFHPHCDYDRLDIITRIENETSKTFCGSRIPHNVISETNAIRLKFSSDHTKERTGFAAVFSTERDECAINNGGCQHVCTKTIGSYTCSCDTGFALMENGRNCKESDCRYQLTSPYGIFTSPNYPGSYPANKECTWQFETTPGHRIVVSFSFFDMELDRDYLTFYNGPSSKSLILDRFTGSQLPYTISSSTNQMLATLTSDKTIQKKGFSAEYVTVCGGNLIATETKKHIYSHPKFGKALYRNGIHCEWVIRSDFDASIKLSFQAFELEAEKECEYDYLEISGYEMDYYGKFCSSNKPPEIISEEDILILRFHTDDTFTAKGFDIVYESIEYSSDEDDYDEK